MTEETDQLAQMLAEQNTHYEPMPGKTERAKEIDAVNRLKPFKYITHTDQEGNIVHQSLIEGDVPMHLLAEYWSLLNPQVSLGNTNNPIDEIILDCDRRIINFAIRSKYPRKWFNERQNSEEDQVNLMYRIAVMKSRMNQERQNTITTRFKSEENKEMNMSSVVTGLKRKLGWD